MQVKSNQMVFDGTTYTKLVFSASDKQVERLTAAKLVSPSKLPAFLWKETKGLRVYRGSHKLCAIFCTVENSDETNIATIYCPSRFSRYFSKRYSAVAAPMIIACAVVDGMSTKDWSKLVCSIQQFNKNEIHVVTFPRDITADWVVFSNAKITEKEAYEFLASFKENV
jgi:hypothetical protein